MTEPCVFCGIANNDSPVSSVYEDDCVMAFLDNRPVSDGHTLVIPKRHFETIYDIPDEEIVHLFKIVKKVAVAVKETVNPEGLTVIQRNGKAAGQHIMHLHIHVIPRHCGRYLRLLWVESPRCSRKRYGVNDVF
jgi:histidine triad (HIT) family protein